MTPEREALEPCPFCGSKMVAQGATAQKTISVWCMKCGTRGPDVPFPDFCEPVAQIELCHQRWNTRASAAPGEPCAVKPLEWRDHRPDSFPEPAWSAQTPFGFYNIEEVSASDSPAYVVRLHAHHFVADKDGLDEAKAAAQADYEQRIKSALVFEGRK